MSTLARSHKNGESHASVSKIPPLWIWLLCSTGKWNRTTEEAGCKESRLQVPLSPQRGPDSSLTLTQCCGELYFLTCLILVFMSVVSFYSTVFFLPTEAVAEPTPAWLGTFNRICNSASHNSSWITVLWLFSCPPIKKWQLKKAKCNAAQKPFHWPENWADFHSCMMMSRSCPTMTQWLQWLKNFPSDKSSMTRREAFLSSPLHTRRPKGSWLILLLSTFLCTFCHNLEKNVAAPLEQWGKCQAEQNYKFKLQPKKRRKKNTEEMNGCVFTKNGLFESVNVYRYAGGKNSWRETGGETI